MNCKYSLRHHLDSLIRFKDNLWEYTFIDYSKKILVSNALQKRINNIKGYLSIDIEVPEKKSINQLRKECIKHIR